MRTILNMKPGPGGQRLQEELEAKTAGSVYWPAFTFDRSEDYEESVKEILEGAERGALLILVSPTTVSFMKDIFPQLPESARFACVGEPTAKALTAAFPAAHEILFRTEALWRAVPNCFLNSFWKKVFLRKLSSFEATRAVSS